MARKRQTLDDLTMWLRAHDHIAHRDELLRAGFGIPLLREIVRAGAARRFRRAWIALPDVSADLAAAAAVGGRITCTSLARRRGWWMPEAVGRELHLHLLPGSPGPGPEWPGVLHWTKPVDAVRQKSLVATTEDALAHIAVCQPFDTALVLWESAARCERLSADVLRGIPFVSRAARELAAEVTGLADSGLESIVVIPLRRWGLRVRQQVQLAGRRVDVLIGERLVLQIDGYEFHSDSAQRTRDIAHDAELRLRGYTVIRLSYAQIVHDWPGVERAIRRAVATGIHLAA